jgi:hypothetical protein
VSPLLTGSSPSGAWSSALGGGPVTAGVPSVARTARITGPVRSPVASGLGVDGGATIPSPAGGDVSAAGGGGPGSDVTSAPGRSASAVGAGGSGSGGP